MRFKFSGTNLHTWGWDFPKWRRSCFLVFFWDLSHFAGKWTKSPKKMRFVKTAVIHVSNNITTFSQIIILSPPIHFPWTSYWSPHPLHTEGWLCSLWWISDNQELLCVGENALQEIGQSIRLHETTWLQWPFREEFCASRTINKHKNRAKWCRFQ